MKPKNISFLRKRKWRLSEPFAEFIVLSLLFTLTLNLALESARAQSAKCKISGYVLDSNGRGIAGADVIFNQPTVAPGVFTDSSGYYETYGPSGTYHMNVWPPFDSKYTDFDQPTFEVAADVSKNVTLNTGFKVSGYISDLSGAPVVGACFFLYYGSCWYGSGYFSNSAGYYFVAVPPGTYRIDAHPRVGTYQSTTTNFPTYYEYNFTVISDTVKNITVGNLLPTPTPTLSPSPDTASFKISGYATDSNGKGIPDAMVIFNVPSIVPSVWTDNSGYYAMYAPAGIYHFNVWPPFDSNYVDYDQLGFVVSSDVTKNITLYTGFKVSGYISDYSGNPITGAVVSLNDYCSGWFSQSNGYYFLSVPAGTYTITAHPRTDHNSASASNFTTYHEYNFTVNIDTIKNITVGNPAPTLASVPASVPTATPTESLGPTPSTSSLSMPKSQPSVVHTPTPTDPAKPISANEPAQLQPDETSWQYLLILAFILGGLAVLLVSIVKAFSSLNNQSRSEQREFRS
ncbi:MAG: carboxypeptidase regulatory-like domain-containing protein [Candidatus Bathyarchaeia archaeon]|jgi:protocatechuate 3,4-dioxygenase beta subunit